MASEPVDIEITNLQSFQRVDSQSLAGLARRWLQAEGIEQAAISIALVDDATIHDLNRRHLGHDWPTDVISFRLSEPDEPELVGEVIVSAEMAARTAREGGFDPAEELALYLVHGLLHLCGYEDQATEEIAAIRRREGELLAAEGLTNTFPLVARSEPGGEASREEARWPV